ncbi:hypothetical protein CPR_C0005 [Clostridium phage phiSM101]|jgi:hypothetical protein|uniref:hypothetical protein n=1 Tax=Clostridium phage phiSM101 TaxID=396359 RepID=UPI0000DB680D|nr:hypothetical protein CPR_C0005 [Clostridium phage phiSM101]EGT4137968.1 hypothetical protein [Clostridium perfringens]ABG87940.1 hypothetical protein CPR_C0005 [Clostridium phage phiSM101]MDK3122659.1 hypothetical protein [Clostridium perfringens]SQB59781.1 Uncharacterised protein [Clostridium perfringens]BDA26682.1 hypothetical protein CPBEC2_29110 [Clostridium perfringens]
MSKEPLNIRRLFLISKNHLKFSRNDFLESTAKEISDLLEELNSMNSEEDDEEEVIEKVVSIDNFPFL